MKQPAVIAVIVAGSIGAAWLLSHTRDETRIWSRTGDGVWVNGCWYCAETHPNNEIFRNFLLAAETAGYEIGQDFKITGASGITGYYPPVSYQLTESDFSGGGFTQADVENWQSAGSW